VTFIANLSFFNNSRPNFNARAQFITTSPFNDHHWKVPGATFWTFELRQFFWECFVFLFLWVEDNQRKENKHSYRKTSAPKEGA
jgi:hypothetical protein